MQPTSEEILIKKAQTGDLPAFEELIRSYQQKIFEMALYRSRNQDLAEDIAQEVIIRIWKNLGKFRFGSAFSTWVYRIVFNTLSTLCRQRGRVSAKEVGVEQEAVLDLNGPGEPGIQEDMEARDIREAVRAAVNALPDKFHFAVYMYDIEGKSYEEIAASAGVPVGTVKSRLNRGRAMVKEYFLKERGNKLEFAPV